MRSSPRIGPRQGRAGYCSSSSSRMAVAVAVASAAIGQVDGAGEGSREDGSERSKPTSLRWWGSCRCLGRRSSRRNRKRI